MGASRRVGLLLAMGLAIGCSKGDALATTGFGPSPWSPLDTEGEEGSGGSGEADTGVPPGTSGAEGTTTATSDPMTSGADSTGEPPSMDSSSGGPPSMDSSGGTFGDDGGNQGMQPASGWWSHCLDVTDCDMGLSCLATELGDDGVCTLPCAPAGNTASCSASPGGTNVLTCLSVQGQSICALDCEGGLSCPGGMVCTAETDDLGPISICL